MSLVPTSSAPDSNTPVPSAETPVSTILAVTDTDSVIHSDPPFPAPEQDTEEKPPITRRPRNREKYSKVAKLLGMMEDANPELMLEKLMDEYLSLKGLAA